ncbi:MAG: 50S ribosomal protein L35 [Patescibacteria group bacterium]
MKTNKAYSKRLKVTKQGKILARKSGQNHFNAKKSGAAHIDRKGRRAFRLNRHLQARFLPGT